MFENQIEKQQLTAGYKNIGIGPGDYYGRFTLQQVDQEIDEMQLARWLCEVQLDFDNNKVRLSDGGESKYRKRLNFCNFFITRINQRLAELKKIQQLSKTIVGKIKKTSPERWQLIINTIVEYYPGVDLAFIIQEVDKEI